MKVSIVIGLGFGDEGKGLMVDQLCRQSSNALVVRFSGGHQCGHTVVKNDGKRHVFAQFGSGTLSGAKTFYSKNCTLDPVGLVREYNALKKLGVDPDLYIDPLCPVVTPYDVIYNRAQETDNKHGSCGKGFGTTIERHEAGTKLFAKDLKYPNVLLRKLKAVEGYYLEKDKRTNPLSKDRFQTLLTSLRTNSAAMFDFANIITEEEVIMTHTRRNDEEPSIIFEGNQGILLDAEHGFFPNVTRSSTTSKLAMEMIRKYHLDFLTNIEIYYMHRAYSTRHGNGWLPNEGEIEISPNPRETNVARDWQGEFRIAPLNFELFQYALETDEVHNKRASKTIVFTCVDQLKSTDDFDNFLTTIKETYPDKYKYLFSYSDSSDVDLRNHKN